MRGVRPPASHVASCHHHTSSEETELKPGGRERSGLMNTAFLADFLPLSPLLRCVRERIRLFNLQRLYAVSHQHNNDLAHSSVQFMTKIA